MRLFKSNTNAFSALLLQDPVLWVGGEKIFPDIYIFFADGLTTRRQLRIWARTFPTLRPPLIIHDGKRFCSHPLKRKAISTFFPVSFLDAEYFCHPPPPTTHYRTGVSYTTLIHSASVLIPTSIGSIFVGIG